MPMTRDDHEALLNELLNREIEHSRLTEVLQSLRNDYTSVHVDFDKLTQSNEKLTRDNNDLIISNSKLFRQVGVTGTEKEKESEQKEFSETINIEELEKEL